jgi:hypothetical protein
VSPAGVSVDDQLLPWSDVKWIRVEFEDVKIHQKEMLGLWKTVSLDSIPHYLVFDGLVRAILAQWPPAEAH